jgi:hypothetical protein
MSNRCPHCSFQPTSDSDHCDRHAGGRRGALWLARQFHEVYERLAPEHGYATREETRKFDPESKNGKLMVAVMAELKRSIHLRHD